jgi:hypothetical protein
LRRFPERFSRQNKACRFRRTLLQREKFRADAS